MIRKHFPKAVEHPIAVRAYVPLSDEDAEPKQGRQRHGTDRGQSTWDLILDTETRTDASQHLRFGVYQLREKGVLLEAGIFHAPDLPQVEIDLLASYCKQKHIRCMPVDRFIEEVFFKCAYMWRASIIGFNLPFDLSRLAIDHGSARGSTMKSGFTFKLSDKRWWPHIQIKNLSRRASLMQFASPFARTDTKRERRDGRKRPTKRGAMVDLKTAASALLSRNFDLKSLAAFLKVQTRKASVEHHGQALTEEYIEYAVTDVQATWECYEQLLVRFGRHGLKNATLGKILSEASLGKAYLQSIGIKPQLVCQPNVPPDLYGKVMSTYYGGRAEVHWRREIKQIAYCDFLSMYPTVCSLMGLWKFVIAESMSWRDGTEDVRSFLASVTPESLQDKETWSKLTSIVKVKAAESLLPIRAGYGNRGSNTIGLNYLTSEQPLWYTLADVIAGKFLSGTTPDILEAIVFEAGPPQADLQPIEIAGHADYRIDPYVDDFFKRLIDLRATVKKSSKEPLVRHGKRLIQSNSPSRSWRTPRRTGSMSRSSSRS